MSAHARVNRECRLGGSSGLYFGSFPTALLSKVSWYKLRELSDAYTVTEQLSRGTKKGGRDGRTGLRDEFSVLKPAGEQPGERTKG